MSHYEGKRLPRRKAFTKQLLSFFQSKPPELKGAWAKKPFASSGWSSCPSCHSGCQEEEARYLVCPSSSGGGQVQPDPCFPPGERCSVPRGLFQTKRHAEVMLALTVHVNTNKKKVSAARALWSHSRVFPKAQSAQALVPKHTPNPFPLCDMFNKYAGCIQFTCRGGT